MEASTVILIIIGIVGLIFLLFAVYLYIKESSAHEFSSTSSVSIRKINSSAVEKEDQRIAPKSATDPETDLPSTRKLSRNDIADAIEQSEEETKVPVNYYAKAKELEEKRQLLEAADIYQHLGKYDEELRLRSQLDPTQRLADLYRIAGKQEKYTSIVRLLLQNSPQDFSLREKVIRSLLLEDKLEEAQDLLRTAIDEKEDLGLTPEFFLRISRLFQASLTFRDALASAQTASDMLPNNQKYSSMVDYLKEVIRLLSANSENASTLKKNEALKAISDTAELDSFDSVDDVEIGAFESDNDIPDSGSLSKPLPHRVIVGHFAQGFSRDLYNLSNHILKITAIDRMEFENLLAQRESSTLFQTRDKLIDSPTVLRLSKTAIREQQQGLLRERFATIAGFSHPNISRVIYVDRVGSLLRIVSEYHQGGSFQSMVSQLKHIGIPFIIRMLLQISNGLVHAHRAGVVHGDLRLENIMVGHDQLMKLTDFAIQPWPVHAGSIPTDESMIDMIKFGELCETLLKHTIQPEDGSDIDDTIEAKKIVTEIPENIANGQLESMAGVQSQLLNAMSLVTS